MKNKAQNGRYFGRDQRLSQKKKINLEKLKDLRSKKNVCDYFDIEREDFFELSKNRQLELTFEFYLSCFSRSFF